MGKKRPSYEARRLKKLSLFRRKEKQFKKKMDNIHQMDLVRDQMELSAERRVNIKAYDMSINYALESWLGFKPRKAIMVDHVIISTDIPLPREDWLKVVNFLEDCVKKQENKK